MRDLKSVPSRHAIIILKALLESMVGKGILSRITRAHGFADSVQPSPKKSFNRTDVLKRHLTSVHAVEHPMSNTGKCSTCSVVFLNAQDFSKHLDDCVLRKVQDLNSADEDNELDDFTPRDSKYNHATAVAAEDDTDNITFIGWKPPTVSYKLIRSSDGW